MPENSRSSAKASGSDSFLAKQSARYSIGSNGNPISFKSSYCPTADQQTDTLGKGKTGFMSNLNR